jgi:hypothetical protein
MENSRFKEIYQNVKINVKPFDVKLAVKRVAYFQTVCPDFIIVL